jgi:hypothetical protein
MPFDFCVHETSGTDLFFETDESASLADRDAGIELLD